MINWSFILMTFSHDLRILEKSSGPVQTCEIRQLSTYSGIMNYGWKTKIFFHVFDRQATLRFCAAFLLFMWVGLGVVIVVPLLVCWHTRGGGAQVPSTGGGSGAMRWSVMRLWPLMQRKRSSSCTLCYWVSLQAGFPSSSSSGWCRLLCVHSFVLDNAKNSYSWYIFIVFTSKNSILTQ